MSAGSGRDFDDEIRHHILERADLLVEQGWERADALREAERRFGDAGRIRREMSEVRGRGRWWPGGGDLLRSVAGDVRYALRGVRQNPVFALAVAATLALGIGAASTIFAVADALLLRPVPYRYPDRLVEVNHAFRQRGGYTPGIPTSRIGRWREAGSDIFDGWLAWSRGTTVRTDGPAAEELNRVVVTPGADTLLGIPLLMGRTLAPEDARPGSADVAVLGRGFYERLGRGPAVLGSTIRLETGPVTVVGVLRGGVRFPTWGDDADLWIPLRDDFTVTGFDGPLPSVHGLWARLRRRVSVEAAQERADVLARALDEEEPLEGGWRVEIIPVGKYRASTDVKRALGTLSATVATIFLIAWVNAVHLILVRASGRGRELVVRLAVGGSRLRLVRQLLVEGLVLGALGGLAALALALVAMAGVRAIVPWEVAWSSPHAFEVEGRTLAFTMGAALLVGSVLGLVPALHALRGRRLLPSLGGRRSDDAPGRRRLRSGMVVAQVALSTALLAVAGLFVKSFARLVSVDPGFDYERIAVATLSLSEARYSDAADREAFLRQLEETLEARPGIEAVAVTHGTGFHGVIALEPEDGPVPGEQPRVVPFASVSLDYLDVTGTELVAGRGFEPSDVPTGAVLVDRDLARFLWGSGQTVVGRRFRLRQDGEWMRVVGVVRELRLMGRDQRDGPYQVLRPSSPERPGQYVELTVRALGDPRDVLPIIRRTVGELDPEQTIRKLQTGAEALAEDEENPRFLVTLMSLLATVAVALAVVGLYGVLAFSVAGRSRELAVRMALGADGSRVRGMVLGQGLVVATVGVLLGLACAIAASRALERLLYEVPPHDPATLAVTALLFLTVAAAAALLPALRATRVDPAASLRRE